MGTLLLYVHDALCEVVFGLLPGWMIRCNYKRINAVYLYFAAGGYRWEDAGIGVGFVGLEGGGLKTRLAVYRWYERAADVNARWVGGE